MWSSEQILSNLIEISNTWNLVAIFWHICFAVIVILLLIGIRPSKRIIGIFIGILFLSVSIISWLYINPFTGIIFAILGIIFIYFSIKFRNEKVQIAPLWIRIAGIVLFIFGWIYPHFLETSSIIPYLYSAPVGVVPCATLTIAMGLMLILNGLNSRILSLIPGIAGIIYGIIGITKLSVFIDWILLLGAIIVIIFSFKIKNK